MSWTKTPNSLFDARWVSKLPHAELVLILWVIRLSEGYQKDWAHVGETQLLELTDLPRSSLYRAKQGLVKRGLLEIDRSGAVCAYRACLPDTSGGPTSGTPSQNPDGVPPAGPRPTSGTGPKTQTPSNQRDGTRLTSGTGRGPRSGTGSILKESIKENSKETSSYKASPGKNDDAFLNPDLDDQVGQADRVHQAELGRQLVRHGMSAHLAHELSQRFPERTRRALGSLPHREGIRNPAGWLFTEITSGDEYGDPPALQAKRKLEARHERAAGARATEARERELEHERAQADYERLTARLTPTELDQVIRDARVYISKASPKLATANADSGIIRGTVLLLLRERASPESRAG